MRVTLHGGGGGVITSNLKDADNDVNYNNAIDGIESLILAHACAGVDIESNAYVEGINSCIDALRNQLVS